MAEKQKNNPDSWAKPSVASENKNGATTIALSGHWTTHTIYLVDNEMRMLEKLGNQRVVLSLSNIDGLDTGGAWLIERLAYRLHNNQCEVSIEGSKPGWESLLKSVGAAVPSQDEIKKPKKDNALILTVGGLGRVMMSGFSDFVMAMNILGSTLIGPQGKRADGRSSINFTAIVAQVQKMGVGAIPIISLMSFIVGAIIAQQGAFQLRNFGAEPYAVDLVGILVFRELAVLMTAIMIAGRSGSAITAELGSMKMQEEIDALKVMGFNPVSVLVFPRLVALVFALPLLTIIADLAALLGAACVLLAYSGIPFGAFMDRLSESVTVSTLFVGLIKAPFMAMVIGIIASVEGMKVEGSSESLGARVTSSVVKAIFVVIVLDGFFAIFYAAINF
ncbi:ABC transporter permease [Bartonella sp. HY038]|uniref:MlaE family ABC transporter permease n=1 Tax=Bartonella sp. HY038 TaxID=2759660 RepID=UPI0015FCCCA2